MSDDYRREEIITGTARRRRCPRVLAPSGSDEQSQAQWPPTLAALAVKPCFCIWELVLQRPEHSLGGPERHLVAADHVFQTDSLARCGGPPRQLKEFLGLVETHRNCPQPDLRYSSGASFFVTRTTRRLAIQGYSAP